MAMRLLRWLPSVLTFALIVVTGAWVVSKPIEDVNASIAGLVIETALCGQLLLFLRMATDR